MIWFKLKTVFCFTKEEYIALCYMVPGNRRQDVDTFDVLANDIAGYQSGDDKRLLSVRNSTPNHIGRGEFGRLELKYTR